jgi:hypothetical protein
VGDIARQCVDERLICLCNGIDILGRHAEVGGQHQSRTTVDRDLDGLPEIQCPSPELGKRTMKIVGRQLRTILS